MIFWLVHLNTTLQAKSSQILAQIGQRLLLQKAGQIDRAVRQQFATAQTDEKCVIVLRKLLSVGCQCDTLERLPRECRFAVVDLLKERKDRRTGWCCQQPTDQGVDTRTGLFLFRNSRHRLEYSLIRRHAILHHFSHNPCAHHDVGGDCGDSYCGSAALTCQPIMRPLASFCNPNLD